MSTYQPRAPLELQQRIREWHERAYAAMRSRGTVEMECVGITLTVPTEVFAPVEPFLLANAVANEVRPGERVLDVGTGSGINAVVAAKTSARVLAVDRNPYAVECARLNVARNGATARVTVLQSDLFELVEGRFDLIVFDPPFRWFKPRNVIETAISDENYESLTRFMKTVRSYLTNRGRVLLHFGTSADVAYLDELMDTERFSKEEVSRYDLAGQWAVSYSVFRVVPQ